MKRVSYIDSNLFSPKDAWDALSMAEKSEMMKIAVQNGITNLDDIRREYNEFAEGGKKVTPKTTGGVGYVPPANSNPKAGTLKDIAYRIMSQDSYQGRTLSDIGTAVLESMASQPYYQAYSGSFLENDAPDSTRDLNHLIVYGNTKKQFKPKKLNGFDYKNFLQKNYGVNTVPTYEGHIVLAKQMTVPEEYKPLVEYMADRPNLHYYTSDEDGKHDIIEDKVSPFKSVDDVASYRRSFRKNDKGEAELAAQDLIDYGANYGGKYGFIAGLQGALLNKVINSPVILDQSVPIKYSNNPKDFSQGVGWYNTLQEMVNNNHILQKDKNGDYSYPLVLPELTVLKNKHAGGGYIDKAKALIKKNEGWMSKPYKDAPEGKSWRSVGYGFNDSGFYDKYPEGISRHYENGITKAQAEQELSYILNKADKHLRSIYGKQWDSFNDNQKAAIMDTYYQRPASVGKKSAFYNAVKSGKDASKYLGVKGFADRNKKRQSVFGGGAVSMIADNMDTSLPQEVALQPIIENIPEFIPLNPQAFNTTLPTYQRPELTFEEPVVQETPVSPYSPEEIERQERAEGLANLGRFLNYTNPEGTGNSLLDTIGILTSTPAVSTAVRNNYVPTTTTPYNKGNNMRRAFESAVAFNRMMDATSLQNNPLPEYQFPIGYAEGGKIHIKPSHRGRLTELKKRTGKSEAELYKTGGPAVRKMITFARNARKWKHGLGGNLFE